MASLSRAKIDLRRRSLHDAFTLVEVTVALAVCVIFGAAAAATNSQLLRALKNSKEAAGASMMLQERKEQLRAIAFNSIANATYIHDNIFQNPTTSEWPLGFLSEKVTVDAYPNSAPGGPIVLLRNSTYPNCQIVSSNSNLSYPSQNLLRVDVVLTWTSSSGRSRTRQFSEVFSYPGNIGQ
jgi:type II secretory pathway pseudopilin PulG